MQMRKLQAVAQNCQPGWHAAHADAFAQSSNNNMLPEQEKHVSDQVGL